jgi:hypothetical protein
VATIGGDLPGTPVLSQERFHSQPPVRIDPRLRARGMPTFHGLAMCRSCLILAPIAHVSPKLAADRYCRTLHLRTDLARGEAAAVKVLNSDSVRLGSGCV